MEWYAALTLLLGTVCVAMFLGLPVAFAFFAANVLGTALFIYGDIGLVLMPMEFHNAIKFTLAPIPLFLLMGEILLHTGVAFKAIGAVDRLITRVQWMGLGQPAVCRSIELIAREVLPRMT